METSHKNRLPQELMPTTIDVSNDQRLALHDIANEVVHTTVGDLDQFVRDNRKLPSVAWKHLKSTDGIQIYKARTLPADGKVEASPVSPATSTLSADSVFSDTPSERGQLSSAQPPQVKATGYIDCSLNDYLLATKIETSSISTLLPAHKKERFHLIRTLRVLERPTKEHPLCFLAIRWFVVERAGIKNREFLILEGSGTTRDSRGNPVGYHVFHSVDLPQLKRITCNIRAAMSFCWIVRPDGDKQCELYCQGYTNLRGSILDLVRLHIVVKLALYVSLIGEEALLKKLQYCAQQSIEGKLHMRPRKNSYRPPHFRTCSLCPIKLQAAGSTVICEICHQGACGKCSAWKKVPLRVDNQVERKYRPFCVRCILMAKSMDSKEFAKRVLIN